MDLKSHEAVQQGTLACLVGTDHHRRLQAFLNGLRRDSSWSEEQVQLVERRIRHLIDLPDSKEFRLRPELKR